MKQEQRKYVGITQAAKIVGKSYKGFMKKVDLGQIPYFMDGDRMCFYIDELTKQPESQCHIKSIKEKHRRSIMRESRSVSTARQNLKGSQLTNLAEIRP